MIGVNVAQLLHAPVGTTRSYPLDEPEPDLAKELNLLTPVVGTLKLTPPTTASWPKPTTPSISSKSVGAASIPPDPPSSAT